MPRSMIFGTIPTVPTVLTINSLPAKSVPAIPNGLQQACMVGPNSPTPDGAFCVTVPERLRHCSAPVPGRSA